MAGLDDTAGIHQEWIRAGATESLADFLDFLTLGNENRLQEGLDVIRQLQEISLANS